MNVKIGFCGHTTHSHTNSDKCKETLDSLTFFTKKVWEKVHFFLPKKNFEIAFLRRFSKF